MCRFHKDVAHDIATDPVTGRFDPARYSVALVALAKYRIEQYMPAMFGCDGYNKYEMAAAEGVKAFAESGLAKPEADIRRYRDGHIARLREAMDATAAAHDISIAGLNLPKNPLRDTRFLDEATVELFEGYTRPGYAAGPLTLKAAAHKPGFEPIRAAASGFLSRPGVEPVLKTMLENSLVSIFSEARKKSGDVLLALYSAVPKGLRKTFSACAACTGSVVVPHLPCLTLMALASSSAVAAAVVGNLPAVAAMSVAAATGGYLSWNRQRGSFASATERRFMKTAFALAAGLMIGMHAPGIGGGSHHHHHAAPVARPAAGPS